MTKHAVALQIHLHGRVIKWSKEDQIEFSAFVDVLREFGIDAVLGNSVCAVAEARLNASGALVSLRFWMKIRSAYEHLTLTVVAPDVFLLGDR